MNLLNHYVTESEKDAQTIVLVNQARPGLLPQLTSKCNAPAGSSNMFSTEHPGIKMQLPFSNTSNRALGLLVHTIVQGGNLDWQICGSDAVSC